MRRLAIITLCFTAAFVMADTNKVSGVTNLVSNVQTAPRWERWHVLGKDGGTLLDKSGTIADYASGRAAEAAAAPLPEIAEGAHEGLTNALSMLYAATNHIHDFTERIYIAGDLQPDDTEVTNFYAFVAAESYANGVDTFWIWFSRALTSAPTMKWRYSTSLGEYWIEGEFEQPWDTAAVTTNGFEGCHRCDVQRPSQIGNITMRANAYPRLGSPADGFDFRRKRFFLTDTTETVTNLPWTGLWTNSTGRVHRWFNGLYLGEVEE